MRDNPLSFQTAKTLRSHIKLLPDAGAQWKSQQVLPEYHDCKQKHELLYHNLVEVIRVLLLVPYLMGSAQFAPVKLFNEEQQETQHYNEMWTGNWWWSVQASLFHPGISEC